MIYNFFTFLFGFLSGRFLFTQMGNKKENSPVEGETYIGLRRSIQEAEKYLEEQSESMKILRDNAKLIFTASSTILPVVSGLQLFLYKPQPSYEPHYLIIYGFILIFYLASAILSVLGFLPISMYQPFPRDYEGLTGSLCGKDEDEMLAQILVNDLDCLEENLPLVKRRVNYVRLAGFFLAIIIVLLLSINFIPKA